MTDIEQKALALVREVDNERGNAMLDVFYRSSSCAEALCRAIEREQAFRQEVSDAVEKYLGHQSPWPDTLLRRFIIPKPDPLVEAWLEAFPGNHIDDAREECAKISAALAARGLEIKEKQA